MPKKIGVVNTLRFGRSVTNEYLVKTRHREGAQTTFAAHLFVWELEPSV